MPNKITTNLLVFALISAIAFLEACRETLVAWLADALDEQDAPTWYDDSDDAKTTYWWSSPKQPDNADDEEVHTECSSEGCAVHDDLDVHAMPSSAEAPFQLKHKTTDLLVDDYICPCGECPWYNLIEAHVAAYRMPLQLKRPVCRVLQAYSTYNEAVGYCSGMVPWALHCVQTCDGNEDTAFAAFVSLCML
ncbi:hypothetical protein SPRG_01484 [Saprolegnia parasitica CBS 223.65]|uniref:Rab-GAP TBC domain-containing protein n=1 Tax=Saprolegnia parasitica (strain CBS 223.65) TaxID=695850 RepID=A0A067CV13_SAPPC|nr:hypothetical protein SPRG_01484 [Saprolegnia parasitica CBS 223.65]KDO34348.1 hypothetical protein SPRG_01484 [Saprolegnia parasitica CBS 223.65]|eukprot:XP_012195084.1 hypothetical protein SPRG_01484 [Saprolegnia parasitica CBS 223.65]